MSNPGRKDLRLNSSAFSRPKRAQGLVVKLMGGEGRSAGREGVRVVSVGSTVAGETVSRTLALMPDCNNIRGKDCPLTTRDWPHDANLNTDCVCTRLSNWLCVCVCV